MTSPANRPLIIGKLQLKSNLVMAPMAGITDLPFRILVKEGGASLVCTEMVSGKGLTKGDRKTRGIMRVNPDEHPLSVQIFGSCPPDMAEAARMAEEAGADIVDINVGCPVRKVQRTGAGAKLAEDEKGLAAVIEAAVKAVSVPVSVKIRIGRVPGENYSPRLVEIAQDSGAAMVTVHARPASVGHSGPPDIDCVAAAVKAARIPVIGNGGIVDELSARAFLDRTGCAGLMIGRAAIGDHGIFSRIAHYLDTGVIVQSPTWEERIAAFKRHAHLSAEYYGERKGVVTLRKICAYYLKGLPNASRIRDRVNKVANLKDLDTLLDTVWESPYFGHEDEMARRDA